MEVHLIRFSGRFKLCSRRECLIGSSVLLRIQDISKDDYQFLITEGKLAYIFRTR